MQDIDDVLALIPLPRMRASAAGHLVDLDLVQVARRACDLDRLFGVVSCAGRCAFDHEHALRPRPAEYLIVALWRLVTEAALADLANWLLGRRGFLSLLCGRLLSSSW